MKNQNMGKGYIPTIKIDMVDYESDFVFYNAVNTHAILGKRKLHYDYKQYRNIRGR
ncbi:MAG: hypothetical protein AABW65_01855 [Nanoarchaeota archaeon]